MPKPPNRPKHQHSENQQHSHKAYRIPYAVRRATRPALRHTGPELIDAASSATPPVTWRCDQNRRPSRRYGPAGRGLYQLPRIGGHHRANQLPRIGGHHRANQLPRIGGRGLPRRVSVRLRRLRGLPPYAPPSGQHWVASKRVRSTSQSYLVHRCWQLRTGGCPEGQTMGVSVYSGANGARHKIGFHVPQEPPDGKFWWPKSRPPRQLGDPYRCYTLINE